MKAFSFQGTEAALSHELFESAPIGMVVTSNNNVLVRVNSAFCRLLGYSKKELLGMTVRDITHPDDWEATSRRLRQMRAGRSAIRRFEKRFRHKSGKKLWTDVSVSMIYDGSGKPRYSIGQVVDITERKEAEEALRLSNERFRVALAGSPTVVFSQDRQLRHTWVNNPAKAFTSESLIGMRDWDMFTPSDARGMVRIKKSVMKTGVGRRDEVVLHLPNGTIVRDLTTEPLRDERGKIIGVICAATDITKHKRLEEALQKANDHLEQKVKDRTLRLRQLAEELTRAEHAERRRIADILHEQLQQHLCGMKFRASHLKEISSEPATIDSADWFAKELDDAIQMTRTLTTDLHPPVLSHLGVRDAIEWLATDVQEKMGLSVTVRIGKRVPMISGELMLFAFEAARELLLNVAKHAKVKTAELRLGSMAKEQVRIQVKDGGIGFDTKQNNEPNSHFGLFRIQERAESFGGRFEVISQPNKGTCVSIILPRGERRR